MPSPEIIENAIYSSEELSELFDIPFQNMRLLIKRGHIKGAKVGKNWFVSGKSLLKVFEEEENVPEPDTDSNLQEVEEINIADSEE